MAYRTKEQQRKYNQTYKEKHRESISNSKKKYASENREKIKEYKKGYYYKNKISMRLQMNKYYRKNRDAYLFMKSQRRAKKDGIEFNITIDDILIPEYCPLLNIKLTNELGRGQLKTNSSLDRIDSSKGYVKGNVWVVSRQANTMKSDASKEELITFALNVLKGFMDVQGRR